MLLVALNFNCFLVAFKESLNISSVDFSIAFSAFSNKSSLTLCTKSVTLGYCGIGTLTRSKEVSIVFGVILCSTFIIKYGPLNIGKYRSWKYWVGCIVTFPIHVIFAV